MRQEIEIGRALNRNRIFCCTHVAHRACSVCYRRVAFAYGGDRGDGTEHKETNGGLPAAVASLKSGVRVGRIHFRQLAERVWGDVAISSIFHGV